MLLERREREAARAHGRIQAGTGTGATLRPSRADPRSPFPRTAEEGRFGVSAERRSLHSRHSGARPLGREPGIGRTLRPLFRGFRILLLCSCPGMTKLNNYLSVMRYFRAPFRRLLRARGNTRNHARRVGGAPAGSDMALDAFCDARRCTSSPNAWSWSSTSCACRARNSLWHCAISCGSFGARELLPAELHRVRELSSPSAWWPARAWRRPGSRNPPPSCG